MERNLSLSNISFFTPATVGNEGKEGRAFGGGGGGIEILWM